MNKDEALKQIEELKEFVKQCDKKEVNIDKFSIEQGVQIGLHSAKPVTILKYNNNLIAYIYTHVADYEKDKEHVEIISLMSDRGNWVDKDGKAITNTTLYFKPHKGA